MSHLHQHQPGRQGVRGGRAGHQVGLLHELHLGASSRPCLDPDNSACMVSLTSMPGMGVMLNRGCCSLKNKSFFGTPQCLEGEIRENKAGSVREVNCVEENCNTGSLEEKRTRHQETQQQLPLQVFGYFLIFICFVFRQATVNSGSSPRLMSISSLVFFLSFLTTNK